MTRRILAVWLLLALAAGPVAAAPVIEGGTYYLQPGLTGQVLTVTVSGGDQVPGVDLYVQIGDGGTVNGGTHAAPTIAALDIVGTGTIFHANHTDVTELPTAEDIALYGPMPLIRGATTITSSSTVAAAGTLAYVTIDTTGALGGSYPLRLQNVFASVVPGGLNTNFTPYSSTYPPPLLPPTIHDGRIVILHPMIWNNGANGTWTGGIWSGSTWDGIAYPDDSAETVIATPYTVSLDDARQTYTLTVGNGGQLSIGAAGALTAVSSVTLGAGGTLTLAPTAGLTAPGLQLSGGTLAVSGGAYALGMPVNSAGGTLSTAAGTDVLTLTGPLTAAASCTLNKTGSGTVTVAGDLDHAGAIAVQGGLLKYDLAAGKTATIGAAATLSIAPSATVELAGALSGTSDLTNRVAVVNDSTAGGLRISGTNQVLGAIGGTGKTAVLAGAALTADSLAQQTLDIAGTGSLAVTGNVAMGSGGLLTLAPGAVFSASSVQLGSATLAVGGGAYSLGSPLSTAGATLSTADAGDSLTLTGALTAAASCTLNKTGSGTLNVTGDVDHAGAIAVQGGLLKYDLAAGKTATIGAAATLSIAPGATVELAGALSGTSDLTNRVAVTNDSTAGGLQISGTNQVLGAIGGTGATDILAGAGLTADSLVQDTLTIGAGGSLVIRETTGGAAAQAVPEPGAIALLLCGLLPLAGYAWRNKR